ncbi:component of SufBCD complex [Jannaschia sp. Os4]|nr:component of SufBCD complex [Jannaschia sp. Os4]
METALEVIAFRSFSNLWFWIALAVLWSTASYWMIGVPFDLVRRAARGEEVARADMLTLAGIHSRRLIHISEVTGLWTTAFAFFSITLLALLGFAYGIEFAQAVFLLFLPMTVVGWLNLRTARRVQGMEAGEMADTLLRHRRVVQFVGMVSIFATTMWGMWTNLNVSVLGGG